MKFLFQCFSLTSSTLIVLRFFQFRLCLEFIILLIDVITVTKFPGRNNLWWQQFIFNHGFRMPQFTLMEKEGLTVAGTYDWNYLNIR